MSTKEEQAAALLTLAGCHLLPGTGGMVVGVWKDLWGRELREALAAIGLTHYEIEFLDNADLPADYLIRKCPLKQPDESFRAWQWRAELMRQQEELAA